MNSGVIIHDSETQDLLQTLAQPVIAKTPNLSKVQFYIINDSSFNAFAVPHCSLIHPSFLDHPGVFFHSAILEKESLGTVILVLFHELGHIAGKHSVFLKTAIDNNFMHTLLPAALGCLLGGVTASALPVLLGLHMSGVKSLLSQLRYTRSHESAADSFAFKNMLALGWPIADGLKMLESHAKKENQDYTMLYMRSHPFFAERARSCKQVFLDQTGVFPEHLKTAFEKVQIKLLAFSLPLARVNLCIENACVSHKIKNYGRAIAAYRQGKTNESLNFLTLFEKDNGGKNQYTCELRSQILFTHGRIDQALGSVNEALSFAPKNNALLMQKSMILMSLPNGFSEVIRILSPLTTHHARHLHLWHWLGMAYSKSGNKGRMHICLAEQSVIMKEWSKAEQHIQWGEKWLQPQDPYFQRAQALRRYIKDHKK